MTVGKGKVLSVEGWRVNVNTRDDAVYINSVVLLRFGFVFWGTFDLKDLLAPFWLRLTFFRVFGNYPICDRFLAPRCQVLPALTVGICGPSVSTNRRKVHELPFRAGGKPLTPSYRSLISSSSPRTLTSLDPRKSGILRIPGFRCYHQLRSDPTIDSPTTRGRHPTFFLLPDPQLIRASPVRLAATNEPKT